MGRLFIGLLAPLILFSASANAVLFDVAFTDKSLYYLGLIFGSVGDLPIVGNDTLLGNIFRSFNQIFIGFTFIILSYVGLISALQTAQEGKVLGQKWAGMVVPIRAGAGLFLLIPDSTGYSNIQQLFMWLILSGIGAANTVWEKVVDYADKSGGIVNTVQYDVKQNEVIKKIEIRKSVAKMLGLLVCAEMINNNGETIENKNSVLPPISILPTDPSSPKVTSFLYPNEDGKSPTEIKVSYADAPAAPATCGSVQPPDFNRIVNLSPLAQKMTDSEKRSVADAFYADYLNDISTVITILEGVSYEAYSLPFALQVFNDTIREMFQGKSVTARQIEAYTRVSNTVLPIVQIASDMLSKTYVYAQPNSNEFREKFNSLTSGKFDVVENNVRAQAIADGWIHGGSFYYTLIKPTDVVEQLRSEAENANIINALPVIKSNISTVESIKNSLMVTDTDEQQLILSYFGKYMSLVAANFITFEAGVFSPPPRELNIGDDMGKVDNNFLDGMSKLGSFRNDMLDWFKTMGRDSDGDNQIDYIVEVARFGSTLILAAELGLVFYAVAIAATMVPAAAGTCMNQTGLALDLVVQFTTGIISAFIMALYVSGALMAFYMPLIPFLFYTFAAVGWVMAVIEAMVAAPLVAMYVATPSQDELGKVQNALIIIIHAFIKPTLIVIGFVIAARVLNVVFDLLLVAMLAGVKSSVGQTGFFGAFGVVFMFAGFVTLMATKAFQIIYMLPDKVIRWIGGQGDGYGEGSDDLERKFTSVSTEAAQKSTSMKPQRNNKNRAPKGN